MLSAKTGSAERRRLRSGITPTSASACCRERKARRARTGPPCALDVLPRRETRRALAPDVLSRAAPGASRHQGAGRRRGAPVPQLSSAGCERATDAAHPDGEALQPLSQPAFDDKDPTRTVPHGDIDGVYRTLHLAFQSPVPRRQRGHAARLAVRAPPGRLHRPSSRATIRAMRAIGPSSSPSSAARDLFEKRVCVDCHEVTRMPELPGFEQWKVEPVKLTQTWMPRARFNHGSPQDHRVRRVPHGREPFPRRVATLLMPTIAGVPHLSRRGGRQSEAAIGLPHVPPVPSAGSRAVRFARDQRVGCQSRAPESLRA